MRWKPVTLRICNTDRDRTRAPRGEYNRRGSSDSCKTFCWLRAQSMRAVKLRGGCIVQCLNPAEQGRMKVE